MASIAELDVYLEIGKKKVFAAVVDWPGWCRAGRDEEAAVQTLLDYRDRYAAAVNGTARDVPAPPDTDTVRVVERLEGNATTDFGAPGIVPALDRVAITERDLERELQLQAECWKAFDRIVRLAKGRSLAKGPRGGGRKLATIRDHVDGAQAAYTRQLGGSGAFTEAVWARWRGQLPDKGPRGGDRWPPRYAIRRAAWHVLDHAWEIEDRLGA